ncbi:MAG TPA: quinone-dependent dihydroorotate dehydrogenase [Polyangiaceae bacterium]|nr:quinone-dependent dihydroorotate dehydrogenase [Polyangiaceae bacterium]
MSPDAAPPSLRPESSPRTYASELDDTSAYAKLLKPLLFLLPAERAHKVAFGALRLVLRLPFARRICRALLLPNDPTLRVRVLGLTLPSPVLLAAGFDKDAKGFEALGALGFGAVEVGTLTAQAQPGNPGPRLFRLPADRALINRMGFNNEGAAAASDRLRGPRSTVVGVNIGKTKVVSEDDAVADYVRSAELLGPHADYVVVNVSSPNTPGLRALQAVDRLRPLLSGVRDALERVRPGRPPALLVKIAPDLSDEAVDEIAELALELGLSGIIATNTTTSRDGLRTPEATVRGMGAGGLSGAPLRLRALQVLRRLRRKVGTRLVLVAAGGIESVDDAWERIRAGASLVQIYTGFIYQGPLLPSRLAKGLASRAHAAGFASVQDAIGSSPERSSLAPSPPQTAPVVS